MRTVLMTDSDLPGTVAEDMLVAAGFSVIRSDSADPRTLAELGEHADALLVQWARITDDLMSSLPRLKLVSRLGIGYDMIDLPAATRRGISIANTPTYCVEEVSSHTVALILGAVRGISQYDRETRDGGWRPVPVPPRARRLSSLTVGLIGYGRIGAQVARACRALGFDVVVADPYVSDERLAQDGFRRVGLDDAFAEADVLTLHAPLTDETHHLVNATTLALMKPESLIVNTCRGGLIDEAALIDALRSHRIRGAALDVFEVEPLPADSELRRLPGVTVTPHAAWYSPEALLDLPREAAQNIIDFFAGKPLSSLLNPEAADGVAR